MVHLCYDQIIATRPPPPVRDASRRSARAVLDYNFETFVAIGANVHYNFPPEFFRSNTLKALVTRLSIIVGYERLAVACYTHGGSKERFSLPMQALGLCGGIVSLKVFSYMKLLTHTNFSYLSNFSSSATYRQEWAVALSAFIPTQRMMVTL